MSADGFFSRFRGFIASDSSIDPLGRYLAACLREALENCPALGRRLLPKPCQWPRNVRFQCEYAFRPPYGTKKQRLADIAFLGAQASIIALVEVKWADTFLEGQIEDYARYAHKNHIPIVFITRCPMTPAETAPLRKRDVSFACYSLSELHAILRTFPPRFFPVVDMVAQYLEENEMIFNPQIPTDLDILLSRMFFGTDRKVVADAELLVDGLPQALRVLFADIDFLGKAIVEHVTYGKKAIRPRPNMWFSPWLAIDDLEKLIAKSKKRKRDDVYLKSPGLEGYGWYHVNLTLGNSYDWFALEVGMRSRTVKTKRTLKTRLALYASFSPDPDGVSYIEESPFPRSQKHRCWNVGTEATFIKRALGSIKRAKKDFIAYYKNRKSEFPREHRHAKMLSRFTIS